MTSLWRDLRHGVRVLARSPGFTIVAALTLALGIGANTAIFTVVDAVLLRPLPFPHSDRIVQIWFGNPRRGLGNALYSFVRYREMRDHSRSFDTLAAACADRLNLTGRDEPEQLQAERVTYNFLTVLGVTPLAGRNFLPEEDTPGGKPVALLSYTLWQRRFGGAPDVVGSTITLNSTPTTVIGITPPDLDLLFPGADVWVTNLEGFTFFTPEQIRNGAGYLFAMGLLKPGVSRAQARAEMEVLSRQYQRQHPRNADADPNAAVAVDRLADRMVMDVRPALLVLSGAVGLVLLIACSNVAGLLLARATARQKEVAIRAALGAGRVHLLRQFLAESVVLAVLSGGLGLLLATWGTALLVRETQEDLPRASQIHTDWQVLAFTLLLSIGSGILFGLTPSLHASNPDLNAVLREGARGGSGGFRRNRVRGLLVVGQVALSMMLLIGAGLLMRSFLRVQHVDPGFDPSHVLTMRVTLPASKYPTDERRAAFFDQVIPDIESIPGVQTAAATLNIPVSGSVIAPVLAVGQPLVEFARRPVAAWQSVTPDYFRTFRIPLIEGRYLAGTDKQGAPVVALVSATLARRLWPGEDAIAKHLLIGRAEIRAEVVGVVGDVKTSALDADGFPSFYLPYAQRPWPGVGIAVRTAGDPAAVAGAVRARIAAADPDLPVTNVRTMQQIVDASFGRRRMALSLLSIFAAAALLLAMVGIYGTMACSVAQRTQEIGIRRALGAHPADILRMVVGQGLALGVSGIALGAAASLALTRLLGTLLFQTGSSDPLVFTTVSVLFVVVTVAASVLPALRAARVDPIESLRCE